MKLAKDNNELISNFRVAWVPSEALDYINRWRIHSTMPHKAISKLLEESDEWMQTKSFSVIDKKITPPSQSKHDYMSLSIYNWPNPDTFDGLPYITRDGHVNPEVNDYDRPSFSKMFYAVETLALAYALTEEMQYANKAIEFLDAWFLNIETKMNPNMLFAQYIPGEGGFDRSERYPAVFVPGVEGEGIYVAFGGVIEGTRMVPLLNVISLLEDCPIWDKDKAVAMNDWFRQFLHWVLDHQHGKDEAGCLNNHGSWYCTQIVSYALFTGEYDIARQFMKHNVKARIKLQIEPDGRMPEELGRANSFHYVIYSLTSFFNLAVLAEQLDIDLWTYETADGRSIRKAMEWLVTYIQEPASWPYKLMMPIEDQLADTVPLLYMAYRVYKAPIYLQLLNLLEPELQDHRYRILFSSNVYT